MTRIDTNSNSVNVSIFRVLSYWKFFRSNHDPSSGGSPDTNQNVEDFEAAWNRINNVYPYLEFKKINWDSIHIVYRRQAENAPGDEFYLVLRDLLAELKDGHVHCRTEGGGMAYPHYPPRQKKDRRAYSPFVVIKYFDKKLRLTGSSSVEYETLPGNIGCFSLRLPQKISRKRIFRCIGISEKY